MPPPSLLLLLLTMMTLPCCSGEWVAMPQNASQRLGLNVTFSCSAGVGYGNVAWAKIDDETRAPTLLFVNNDRWNADATRRMRTEAMPGGGFSLMLTSLERNDDALYQCSISNLGSHTARLTVLGMSPHLCLSLSCALP